MGTQIKWVRMLCLDYHSVECDRCCDYEFCGNGLGVFERECCMANMEKGGKENGEGLEGEGRRLVDFLEVGLLEVEGCLGGC
jgi:hypothetical protein